MGCGAGYAKGEVKAERFLGWQGRRTRLMQMGIAAADDSNGSRFNKRSQ